MTISLQIRRIQRFFEVLSTIAVFLGVSVPAATHAQEVRESVHAIITPFQDLHHEARWDDAIRLSNQRFIILLYQNAAAVYSEATFTNTGSDSMRVELALPSKGYQTTIEGADVYNTTILGPRIWVEGSKLDIRTEENDEADWFTVVPTFAPGEVKVLKALFWVSTAIPSIGALQGTDSIELAPGSRHLLVMLSDAAIWRDEVNHAAVTVILGDGLIINNCSLRLSPQTYDSHDSTAVWNFDEVGPSEAENIHCSYQTAGIPATPLSSFGSLEDAIIHAGYDRLLELAAFR